MNRDARFATKWVQLALIVTNPGHFQIKLQYLFGEQNVITFDMKTSRNCPIWRKTLTHFERKSDSPEDEGHWIVYGP